MSLFSTLTQWVTGLRRTQGVQITGPASYESAAASTVTFDSAMQLSAVWACVKLLAETVSTLPLNVYRIATDGTRTLHKTHPLHILFSGKVNRYQNRIEFLETLMLNLVTSGNAYILVGKAGDRIVSLLPLMSAQIEVTVLADGSVVYAYSYDGGIQVYSSESIWHIKMMGSGTVGMSPMDYQRNTVGIAQAAEGAVTKIYRNGAKPSGVLSMDRMLTPTQRTQVRTNFATLTSSEDDRLMVLEGGMKFEKISLSPQDIELLSSRKYQISEICRWYGVPSVLVNDSNGTSVWGSGIEQIVEGFYKLALRPILEKLELSAQVVLLTANERDRMQIEFDFDSLLRANLKARYEGYRVGIASAVLTPNEARAAENLPPMAGGDVLLVQGAMIPIEMAGVKNDNANQNDPVQPVGA